MLTSLESEVQVLGKTKNNTQGVSSGFERRNNKGTLCMFLGCTRLQSCAVPVRYVFCLQFVSCLSVDCCCLAGTPCCRWIHALSSEPGVCSIQRASTWPRLYNENTPSTAKKKQTHETRLIVR